MRKTKSNTTLYKFYFNFATANQRALKKYYIHLSGHKQINVVGSNKNGIMIDDFDSKTDLILALKKLIKKFRDNQNPYEIIYCPKCFSKAKKYIKQK